MGHPDFADMQLLNVAADDDLRSRHYTDVIEGIKLLLHDEPDWVAAMTTVACQLHHAFEYYHWTGFYCMVPATTKQSQQDGASYELAVGPYQGHLGCLRIPLSRGVCGAAAKEASTQLVPDVTKFPGYIACASSTKSEVVVPVFVRTLTGTRVIAVLDIDSDHEQAFTEVDAKYLEQLCQWLAFKYSVNPA